MKTESVLGAWIIWDQNTWCNSPSSNMKFRKGRCDASLPWKQFQQAPPDNYNLSQQRLFGLLRHPRQNLALHQDYNSIILEQIEKGIVEDASVMEPNWSTITNSPTMWLSVVTKTQPSYAQFLMQLLKRDGKPSLNYCLIIGHKFNERLQTFIPDCTNSWYRRLPHDLRGGKGLSCSLLSMVEQYQRGQSQDSSNGIYKSHLWALLWSISFKFVDQVHVPPWT